MTAEEQIVVLKAENTSLKEQVKRLENEKATQAANFWDQLNKKDSHIKKLTAEAETERTANRDLIRQLYMANTEVIKMVQENVKNIAFKKRLKEGTAPSPTYIKGLSTDKLVQDYIANNYKLTSTLADKYTSKYGITYNGLRLRLIKAGVWRSKKGEV